MASFEQQDHQTPTPIFQTHVLKIIESLYQLALGASDEADAEPGEETAEEGWSEDMESEAEGFEDDQIIEPTAVHQNSHLI